MSARPEPRGRAASGIRRRGACGKNTEGPIPEGEPGSPFRNRRGVRPCPHGFRKRTNRFDRTERPPVLRAGGRPARRGQLRGPDAGAGFGTIVESVAARFGSPPSRGFASFSGDARAPEFDGAMSLRHGRRRLHHATTASIDDDLLIAVKEIARSEANQRRCVGPVATIAAPRCARQSGRRIGFRPFSERGGVVINELRPRERSGDRRRRDSCVVHNALKYNCISGTRNFLSSGTENCEFATPRKPFSRIPTQAAPPPHVRVTPGPSLPRDTGATVHFCFAVARLRDPCRRAERTAGRRPGSGH